MAIGISRRVGHSAVKRDQGLVRAVGAWAFAATIVNGVVGGGIFSLPAALSGAAGGWAPLALVICAFAIGAVNLCAAEASGRVATSGGAYGYADAAFGPVAAFVTGVLVWLSSVLACGGIAAALVDGLAHSLPVLGDPLWRGVVIALVIGGLAAINVAGVDPAARFVTALTVLKLVPLFVLVVVGGGWLLMHGGAPMTDQPPPTAIGQAFILALFAFSGMETPLAASGEISNPARNIPRALLIATLFTALLYVAIQLVVQGLLGHKLPGSATPLADAMGTIAPWLGLVLLFGASLSRFGWIGSDIFGAPRVLFAFARDGMLPSALGAAHPRTHAPHVAITLHSLLAILLAISGTFEALAILSGLATAGIYILICAAAWHLHRRGVTSGESAVRYAALPYAAAIGILAMLAIIAFGAPREIIGLAATVVLSAAWAAWRVRARA
ncbi:MAG TPA: amino acid permease [Sphingobium sp.]